MSQLRLAREHKGFHCPWRGCCFSQGVGQDPHGCGQEGRRNASRHRAGARTERPHLLDLGSIALAEAEARATSDRAAALLDEALLTTRPRPVARLRSENCIGRVEKSCRARPRANPAPAGRRLPGRHRGREAKARAASNCAQRCRWPSFIPRPASAAPTPFSPPRSKGFPLTLEKPGNRGGIGNRRRRRA